MSSFAKNSRGSRIDPKLLFGDDREHLPGRSEGAEKPQRRGGLGRYGQEPRGERGGRGRDGDDRDRDRDDRGPPPSRAEENGWGRVSQPPKPGIRLTQGDPEGESNWRSNDAPPRNSSRGSDYDDRRFDSRGPPRRFDSRDDDRGDRYDSRRGGGGDSRFGGSSRFGGRDDDRGDRYDSRRGGDSRFGGSSRFGSSRGGDSRFSSRDGRGGYDDRDDRFERRRAGPGRFGDREDRFGSRRGDSRRDDPSDKFSSAFSKGGQASGRWTRKSRTTSSSEDNNNSVDGDKKKSMQEKDGDEKDVITGDGEKDTPTDDGDDSANKSDNKKIEGDEDNNNNNNDDNTNENNKDEAPKPEVVPNPSRRWDALNTGKSTIRGKAEFRTRDGVIEDRSEDRFSRREDPRDSRDGPPRYDDRRGGGDRYDSRRDDDRRGGSDYDSRGGGRFGGRDRYDSRDSRRDDYDSRDRFGSSRRDGPPSRYDDRRGGDRYDSRDSRPPYDSNRGGGRFGGRGGDRYDSRDSRRDDYDRRDRGYGRRDYDRDRRDDRYGGRGDARPAHLRFGKKGGSNDDRNDSNNSNSNNNNNEPQIQAKKEMLRPLAKKKLQDHVKEYLNNYSKEMKMEKAVEIRREGFPEKLRPDLIVWAVSLSCDFDSVAQDRVAELLVEFRQQRPPIMTSKEFVRGLELTVGRLPDLETDCPSAKKIVAHMAKICQNGKCWDEEDEASAAFCGVLALTTNTNGDEKTKDDLTAVVDGKVETLSPLLLKFKDVVDKNGSKDALDWTMDATEEMEAVYDISLKEQLKAIQIVIEKLAQLNFPLDDSKKFKYVSEGVFHNLYDKDILPGEAFVAWAEDTSVEYEGKMNVLIQVTRYITWLKENDDDESESEEDEDDE